MALVTWDKLMEHRTRDDLWLAIDGKAYDVTSWSRLHPGGALVLMHLAGKDATQQFHACHPPHIKDLLPRFYKGTMAPSTASNISSKVKGQQSGTTFCCSARPWYGQNMCQHLVATYFDCSSILCWSDCR